MKANNTILFDIKPPFLQLRNDFYYNKYIIINDNELLISLIPYF